MYWCASCVRKQRDYWSYGTIAIYCKDSWCWSRRMFERLKPENKTTTSESKLLKTNER